MPSFVIWSGSSASAVMCSSDDAISCARSASRSGVVSFGGLLTRSRARFVHSATVAARSAAAARPSPSPSRTSEASFGFGSSCFQRAVS